MKLVNINLFCYCPTIPIPCNMQRGIVSHEDNLKDDNYHNGEYGAFNKLIGL